MSDSIVLWRMCVVWDRARLVCVLALTMLVATLGIVIANLVLGIHALNAGSGDSSDPATDGNTSHSEIVSSYAENHFGLVAAFALLTLVSNLCATAFVARKAWYALSMRLGIAGG